MLIRAILLVFLLLLSDGDGKKKGRRGNTFYDLEQYEEAVTAYREGLLTLEGNSEAVSGIRYGLQNNVGAALHRMGEVDAAKEAFQHALALTTKDEDFGRTFYNAGNNAFAGQDLEAALDHYRRALLSEPDNMDAKFNYEFVKRRIEQQQQNQQENQDQQNEEQEQNQSEQNNQQNRNDQQEPQQSNQQEEQQNEASQENQQQQQPPPDPNKLSEEQAERILQALQNEEEQLLRQVQRMNTRARRVEKDW